MKVTAKIYTPDVAEKYSHEARVDVPADGSVKAFDLPKPDGLNPAYFLRLDLHDAAGKLVSDNFYWLSTKPDVLDWKRRKGTAYTPQADYADLTALSHLPNVKLALQETVEHQASGDAVRVTVRNPTNNLAFMVHLRLAIGHG